MNNPFSLTFGEMPNNYIDRLFQSKEIIDSFEKNTSKSYMITGVRGTGKTVMLFYISDYFSKKKDWAIVELITETDMLDQFASRLYDTSLFHKIIDGKTFGFSFNGLSFSISGEKPITNVVTLIETLIRRIEKKGKKVLVCVDEAVNNTHMKAFVQTFQLLIREKLPLYLVMTGLYQNIYDLQNNPSLNFLYRSPRITLEPLNIRSISSQYKETFHIDEKQAVSLARLTKGYAYAYQVLGYLLWENKTTDINERIMSKYDQYLQEYVYEKIWMELSENDRLVLSSFQNENETSIEEIKNQTGLDKKTISVYRDRLIKRGIIESVSYGKTSLRLPRFYEFVQSKLYRFF